MVYLILLSPRKKKTDVAICSEEIIAFKNKMFNKGGKYVLLIDFLVSSSPHPPNS